MTYSIPGHRIKLLHVGCRYLDRSNDPAICPLADLIVSPNDNIGPFTCLGREWKTIGDLFRSFDPYRNPVILFELIGHELHGDGAVRIHPDYQLPVRPSVSNMSSCQ